MRNRQVKKKMPPFILDENYFHKRREQMKETQYEETQSVTIHRVGEMSEDIFSF